MLDQRTSSRPRRPSVVKLSPALSFNAFHHSMLYLWLYLHVGLIFDSILLIILEPLMKLMKLTQSFLRPRIFFSLASFSRLILTFKVLTTCECDRCDTNEINMLDIHILFLMFLSFLNKNENMSFYLFPLNLFLPFWIAPNHSHETSTQHLWLHRDHLPIFVQLATKLIEDELSSLGKNADTAPATKTVSCELILGKV